MPREREDNKAAQQNTTMGGLDPDIERNEKVTPDNALTPDSMTPPTKEEAVRQKSYAQMRREHQETDEEKKAEEARVKAAPKIAGGRLSVAMQSQPVSTALRRARFGTEGLGGPTPGTQHYEDTDFLPKFSEDDARKLKGGEGQQFRVDAVKMVEAETARVAQLHELVGTEDIHLGCDGLPTDPPNDFGPLDAALEAAKAQVEVKDDGDSDVKEIAIISEALQLTARYWAIAGDEASPPPTRRRRLRAAPTRATIASAPHGGVPRRQDQARGAAAPASAARPQSQPRSQRPA